MSEVDRFHRYMRAEHERKKKEKAIRDNRNATYVAISCCSVIPSWVIFILFVFRYFVYQAMIPVFLFVYINTTGFFLIIYTIHYYRRLKQ